MTTKNTKHSPVTIKGKTYYNTKPTPKSMDTLTMRAAAEGLTLITPDYIRNNNMSILGLAKLIQADFANTRYALTGKSLPNLSRARKIANVVGLPLDSIRFPKEFMD